MKINNLSSRRGLVFLGCVFFVELSRAACTFSVTTDQDLIDLQGIGWNLLVPAGGVICVLPNSQQAAYTHVLNIVGSTNGTTTNPITVTAKGNAGVVLTGGVNIRQSSNVILKGFISVSAPVANLAALVVDQGSHHISIIGNTFENSQSGISFGDQFDGQFGGPAGAGNLVQGNIVRNNEILGVAFSHGSDGINHQTGVVEYNRIASNVVQNNGGHGIDVDNSSYIDIESNTVTNNGTGLPGISGGRTGGWSGIHLYSDGSASDNCIKNIVRYNLTLNTQEVGALDYCVNGNDQHRCADGNGIQVDHFCDRNEVSYNISSGNAGVGIHIFAAAFNDVHSNTVYGNNLQKDRTIAFSPDGYGEIYMATYIAGRSVGNSIYDNIAFATTSPSPAITINSSVAGSVNAIGPNMLYNKNVDLGGNTWSPFYWIGTPIFSASGIDAVTGRVGTLISKPKFLDVSLPNADGFQLTAKPALSGIPPNPILPDKLGGLPPKKNPTYFGGYYE